MKGQWIGTYHGSAEGRAMINVDEVEDHFEAVAYLNPSTKGIPASVAYLGTTNKDLKQGGRKWGQIFTLDKYDDFS